MQTQPPVQTTPSPLTRPQLPGGAPGLRVKTHLKAGGISMQHNQTMGRVESRVPDPSSLVRCRMDDRGGAMSQD